jgi:WhiB family redox-sensing transcriptional regulator
MPRQMTAATVAGFQAARDATAAEAAARALEVARLLSKGLSRQEAAWRMSISKRTVERLIAAAPPEVPKMTIGPRPKRGAATGWQDDAACGNEDPGLFFGHDGERGGDAARVAMAKAVCARCPVTGQCLKYATETNQRYGVWAGLTAAERGHDSSEDVAA